MGVWGQPHPPAALPPPPSKETRYPSSRRLGAPQGPVWTQVENLSSPGLDPKTV